MRAAPEQTRVMSESVYEALAERVPLMLEGCRHVLLVSAVPVFFVRFHTIEHVLVSV